MKSVWKIWVFVIASIAYIGVEYLLIYYFGHRYSSENSIHSDRVLREDLQNYSNISKELQNRLSYIVANYIQKDEIVKIIKKAKYEKSEWRLSKLRDNLEERFSNTYSELKKDGFEVVHFHLPKAVSFLRLHKPDQYGDELFQKREDISLVNSSGKYLDGYEIGLFGGAFRYIYPLFDEDEFIGSVEIGVSEKRVIEEFKTIEGVAQYSFIIRKDLIEQNENLSELYKPSLISPDFESLKVIDTQFREKSPEVYKALQLNIGNEFARIKQNNFSPKRFYLPNIVDNLIVTLIPVKSGVDKDIGYIVVYRVDPMFDKIKTGSILHFALSSLAILSILVLFIYREVKRAEVTKEKKYFETIFNFQKDFVLITDGDHISKANNSLLNFLKMSSISDFKKKYNCICDLFEVIDKPTYIYKDKHGKNWIKTLLENQDVDYRAVIKFEGEIHTFLVSASEMSFDDDKRSLVILREISELVEYHNKLEDKVQEQTKELSDNMKLIDENVIMSATDKDGKITYVSEAFLRKTGFDRDYLIGKIHSVFKHPDTPNDKFRELWSTITKGIPWQGEMQNRDIYGRDFWLDVTIYPKLDENRNINGYVAIRHDVTDKKLIEKLESMDPLTSLKNRREFNKVFESEFNLAFEKTTPFSMMIVEIDNLKKYNNTYGYLKGDSLIRSISIMFRKCSNISTDHLFRLGGGELCAIYPFKSEEEAFDTAEKLEKILKMLDLNTLIMENINM